MVQSGGEARLATRNLHRYVSYLESMIRMLAKLGPCILSVPLKFRMSYIVLGSVNPATN